MHLLTRRDFALIRVLLWLALLWAIGQVAAAWRQMMRRNHPEAM